MSRLCETTVKRKKKKAHKNCTLVSRAISHRSMGEQFWNHYKKCVDFKNAECESHELSLLWDNMRTAVWGTAPQMALRNYSREMGGRTVYM